MVSELGSGAINFISYNFISPDNSNSLILTNYNFKATMRKIRLFIAKTALAVGSSIIVADGDFEYLTKVMRQKAGDSIEIFNGKDGDFLAEISAVAKKNLSLLVVKKLRDLESQGCVTLAFAPVKNVRIDFVAAKATEMGVASFAPIITQHTIVDKINEERFRANVKEACEQCERNDFPQIATIKKLEKFLAENAQNFDEQNTNKNAREKILILCDETHQGRKASELLPEIFAKKFLSATFPEVVILIGPEGGFSKEEFAKMRTIKNLYSMSLGKRILRADTAIIAALALVNEFLPQ